MVRDVVTIFGVIAGFTYYVLTVRNAQETRELTLKAQKQSADTRQAQLLMQIYAHLREDKFNTQYTELQRKYEWRDYDDFMEKLGDDIEFRAMFNYVCSFFEGVGVLVHRNLLDPQLVDDLMSSYIFLTWEKIGPYIKEIRLRRNRPELWDKFTLFFTSP
jgi:transposase-like protein